MTKTFKGSDRRKLTKMLKVIDAIANRDGIVSNVIAGGKSQAISNKVYVVDPLDAALATAWATVRARLVTLLAMTS